MYNNTYKIHKTTKNRTSNSILPCNIPFLYRIYPHILYFAHPKHSISGRKQRKIRIVFAYLNQPGAIMYRVAH